MAVYRVWAESISYVFVDIEAEIRQEKLLISLMAAISTRMDLATGYLAMSRRWTTM